MVSGDRQNTEMKDDGLKYYENWVYDSEKRGFFIFDGIPEGSLYCNDCGMKRFYLNMERCPEHRNLLKLFRV